MSSDLARSFCSWDCGCLASKQERLCQDCVVTAHSRTRLDFNLDLCPHHLPYLIVKALTTPTVCHLLPTSSLCAGGSCVNLCISSITDDRSVYILAGRELPMKYLHVLDHARSITKVQLKLYQIRNA